MDTEYYQNPNVTHLVNSASAKMLVIVFHNETNTRRHSGLCLIVFFHDNLITSLPLSQNL